MPSDGEHLPSRPSWDCARCGKPWPCDPAREALAVEYRRNWTGLIVLLWNSLEQYALDLGPGPFGDVYDRFMGWARTLREGG